MNYFSGEDLIFYKDVNSGKIMSGGYSIDSILLKDGISPMTTLNTDNNVIKGGSNQKVSNIFENLAVPAGLFYYDQKGGKDDNQPMYYQNTTCISEDLHDKLFKLVELNSLNKKTKTYKIRKSKNNDKAKSNKFSRKNK
jgi:hypothetical protein